MAEVGVAFVSIVPSARGFGSKLNAQTGPASAAAGKTGGKRFGGTFLGGAKSALKGFGGVIAAVGIGKLFSGAIREASDLEESINAVRVSYGKSADDILDDRQERSQGLRCQQVGVQRLRGPVPVVRQDDRRNQGRRL